MGLMKRVRSISPQFFLLGKEVTKIARWLPSIKTLANDRIIPCRRLCWVANGKATGSVESQTETVAVHSCMCQPKTCNSGWVGGCHLVAGRSPPSLISDIAYVIGGQPPAPSQIRDAHPTPHMLCVRAQIVYEPRKPAINSTDLH